MSLAEGASSGDKVRFMFSSEPIDPCSTIIDAVAWVTGNDIDELSPLSHAIDPDSLNDLISEMNENALWRSSKDNPTESTIQRIEFEYAGTTIVVEPGGFTITQS